jgi:hypothetical protein
MTFLDGLTERDIATLANIVGAESAELVEDLRRRPWSIHDLLADPGVFETVLDRNAHPADVVSPFLLFSVLVHRAAEDLREATYVNDWSGPRSRLPVFDVAPLQEFVQDPGRTLFLSRLLASFVVPERPPVPANPFDLGQLAMWIDQVMPEDRPTLLRRLGDLALFLTGVFPDHTGAKPLLPAQAERLGRTVSMNSEEILALCDRGRIAPGLDALEALGVRWYEAAVKGSAAPPVVADVAHRFNAARRVLNHLTDAHLYRVETGWGSAA